MKNIIISGANGNLGKHVVQKFLDEGWHVEALVQPGTYMENFEKSNQLSVTMLDLNLESETSEVIQMLFQKLNNIDACVMLAGGFAMSDFSNTDYELMQRMFHLNFFTAFNLVSALMPLMMQQNAGNRLVFIGAKPALDNEAGKSAVAYSLSKSLLFKLSELINAAGKNKNVLSSVIVPSIIDTPANRAAMPDADFSKWIKPEKLAALIFENCNNKQAAISNGVLEVYAND
jgi:NAD(P)-dependent dehydrogenase (short-subunit alcohol dehydrogenase family)